jgi:hypothetical protein
VATQEAVPDEPILIKPYSEKVPLSSEIAKFPLFFLQTGRGTPTNSENHES